MYMRLRLFSLVVVALTLEVVALAPAVAEAADPAVKVVCEATVVVGETLHCTVTGTAGLTPTPKLTYTNPLTHSTINVANSSVMPTSTTDGIVWTTTYKPSVGEAGRTEAVVETVYVPTYPGSRLTKPFSGVAYVRVLAA
jgi:hypothetical protein